jgi:N utilization substance protein A
VLVDDDTKEATVIVPDDQLALAIGKEGLNARLAARLTGWRIDIQSDSEFAQAEAAAAYGGDAGGEEFTGRCAAVLANGKRCPNEALPGSRYCGIPAHQELALRDTEDTEIVETEDEPALEIRSDLLEPEAESIGPGSVEPVRPEEELESEGTADDAATHGPDATAVAEAEGEVDLDTVLPQIAEPEELPAGIPLEQVGEREEETPTA